jgi:preprotein translocase subunit SecB
MNETDGNGSNGGEPAAEAGTAEAQPPISIGGQYIKDLSFEAPTTPAIFDTIQASPPNITVNIDVSVNHLQDRAYEVVLGMKAECKSGEQVAFILELTYGGAFQVNVPDDQLQPVLLIECPRLLFPFARAIIADATRDGGFPPLILGPVDFVAMYQRQLAQQRAAQGDAPPQPQS